MHPGVTCEVGSSFPEKNLWWLTPVVPVAWDAGAGLCLRVQGQHPGCQATLTCI